MKDVSAMTREELIALKKAIDSKLADQRALKSDLLYGTGCNLKIGHALKPQLEARGVTDPHSVVYDLYKHIFKIVDLTLGNYKVRKTRAHTDEMVPCSPGGYLYIDDHESYKKMLTEIAEVIEKYSAKGEVK